MNAFEKNYANAKPGLGKCLRIHAGLTDDDLGRQLRERLLALWHLTGKQARFRELLPRLFLDLEVITNTDLMKGGRDGAAFRNRAICCEAADLIKTGQARNKREAAKILFKSPNEMHALGTIRKLLSVKDDAAWKEPRSVRRRNDQDRVLRVAETAVAKLEIDYELTGSLRNRRAASISKSPNRAAQRLEDNSDDASTEHRRRRRRHVAR